MSGGVFEEPVLKAAVIHSDSERAPFAQNPKRANTPGCSDSDLDELQVHINSLQYPPCLQEGGMPDTVKLTGFSPDHPKPQSSSG